MARKLRSIIILVCITTVLSKSSTPELPPCPTNFQFLPQNLPMHCKMTNPPAMPPPFPPIFPGFKPIDQNPPNGNRRALPAVPPMPMPMAIPPMPAGMPPLPAGMPGMPLGMPPGMPMTMPLAGPPQAKLPVIVMPFYSQDSPNKHRKPSKKPWRPKPHKRKIRIIKKSHSDTDTDTSSSTDTDSSSSSSSESDRNSSWWKNRRAMRRRKKIRHTSKKPDYLTPVLQYVSNDGYVIFEKEISKGEAKDWLGDNDTREKGSGQNEEPSTKQPTTDSPKVFIKKTVRRMKPTRNQVMPLIRIKQQKTKEKNVNT